MKTHDYEYAYEVTIGAVVTIRATDESAARTAVYAVLRSSLSYYSKSDKDLIAMLNEEFAKEPKIAEELKILDIAIDTNLHEESPMLVALDGDEDV